MIRWISLALIAAAWATFTLASDGRQYVAIDPTSTPSCGPYQDFNNCGTACPMTCKNYFNQVNATCAPVCVPGCFCKPGYILNHKRKCVPPAQWHHENAGESSSQAAQIVEHISSFIMVRLISLVFFVSVWAVSHQAVGRQLVATAPVAAYLTPKETPSCGPFQDYSDCGTACPMTCNEYFTNPGDKVCPAVCVAGCFCKPGYILNHLGKCVKPIKCEKTCTCTYL
ncbi:von Willebrand factor-like [Uranotaenia lowii]|uniref:von Willebrand factor-like n=1 Tax=Uranotaenia lowii TaxID=190385 RepID=UPI0024787290|nr:von Willebrand factor-like [Uranotaenia lowii]